MDKGVSPHTTLINSCSSVVCPRASIDSYEGESSPKGDCFIQANLMQSSSGLYCESQFPSSTWTRGLPDGQVVCCSGGVVEALEGHGTILVIRRLFSKPRMSTRSVGGSWRCYYWVHSLAPKMPSKNQGQVILESDVCPFGLGKGAV